MFLEIFRGVCVLLVILGHLRSFLFVNYLYSPVNGLGVKFFYFITSLGHYGVIVFFVISGFLCGGMQLIKSERFSLGQYLINRFSRIYIVLIPTLIITFIFDSIGMGFGFKSYFGYVDTIFSINYSVAEHISIQHLLSTIALVNSDDYIFGSNTPLWSLSYEFWFYILFAFNFDFFCEHKCSSGKKIIKLSTTILFIIISFIVFPPKFYFYFLLWLSGAISGVILKKIKIIELRKGFLSKYLFFMYISVLFGVFVLFKVVAINALLRDVIVMLYFVIGIFIYSNVELKCINAWKVIRDIGKISYSLYAIHFPIAFLLCSFVLEFNYGNKLIFGWEGMCVFILIVIIVIAVSHCFYYSIENKHHRLRTYLREIIFTKVHP